MRLRIGNLLTLFLLFLCSFTFGQEYYAFKHYRATNGLASEKVNCVIKDKTGYVWIGTDKGLSRSNSIAFRNFYSRPSDSLSLPSNIIKCFYVDNLGTLWIGTTKGICVYNPYKDSFERKMFLKDESVLSIWENGESGLFLSTNRGLFSFDFKSEEFLKIPFLNEMVYAVHKRQNGNILVLMPKGLVEYSPVMGKVFEILMKGQNGLNEILRMYVANDSIVFLGMHGFGCRRFNIINKRFERIPLSKNDSVRMSGDVVHAMASDASGKLWLGTTRGIKIYDQVTHEYTEIKSNLSEPDGLNSNNISTIYHDKEGVVWIGTEDAGLNVYNRKATKFKPTFPTINSNKDKDIRFTKSFLKDSRGEIWIGTDYGLFRFDKNRKLINTYRHDPAVPHTIGAGGVASLYEDSQGRFWVGTWGGGLGLFDRASGNVKRYEYHDDRFNQEFIGDSNVLSITEDDKGNLWLGMIDYILDVYNPTKNEFQHFVSGDFNWKVISDDERDRTWFCSDSGLCVIDRKSLEIKRYLHDPINDGSISDNSANGIAIDKKGNIWVATNDGLNYFSIETAKFSVYKTQNGFSSNYILSVVVDDLGKLWVSHDKGISRFDPETKSIVNFDENDGAKVNCSFSYIAPDGELFFGGADGMINFYPSEVSVNLYKPTIVVSNVTIFNKPVQSYEDVEISGRLDNFDEVRIPYEYSFITFEFAALNFTIPEKSQFAYRFNERDAWSDMGNKREITIANLKPGSYELFIKASNNDGVWNEEGLKFKLVILPPFYMTTFFNVLVVLVILSGIYIWSVVRLRQAKTQAKRLGELVQQRTHELEEQKGKIIEKNVRIKQISDHLHLLDQQRINFLINISHEFRTPLVLIISPLERLLNKMSAGDGTFPVVQSVFRNAQRLLRLVNQVLDIQKFETGNMKLCVAQDDLVQFLRNIHFSFLTLAERKGISICFDVESGAFKTFFDKDKIEKVVFNLLSNAFKFTPREGKVTLAISGILNLDSTEIPQELKEELLRNGFVGDTYTVIKVMDTGVGISVELRKKIFDRFYQAVDSGMGNLEGTGIGLNLAKDMVQLHHGVIWVEENKPKGSMFCFILPVLANQYKKGEIMQTGLSAKADDLVVLNDPTLDFYNDGAADDEDSPNDRKLPLVLIVDDNQEFRVFMKRSLENTFHVVVAGNGTVAFSKALQVMPDIIVSDVMMSEMDGVELCKKIKMDERTSHIPVILLTAKIGIENYVIGLDTGADDYISKPFNLEALKARILNLISSRRSLSMVFGKSQHTEVKDITYNTTDERFLKRAIDVVEKHLSDVDFDAQVFSREIGMGKTNLYLKLKSLTGGSVNEFIKSVRLKIAVEMLKQRQLTITEVAFKTGFSSQSYFTRCFKVFFGKSPSDFLGMDDPD